MAKDPYKYFRIEAAELLEQLGKSVLALEKAQGAPAQVSMLLRLTHTLKGAARVVRLTEIANRAHAMEGLLAPFRDASEAVPRERMDAVVQLLGEMNEQLAALPASASPAAPGAPAVHAEAVRTIRTDVVEMDALREGLSEASALLRRLRLGLQPLARAQRLAHALPGRGEPLAAGAAPGEPMGSRHVQEGRAELLAILGGCERTLSSALDQMEREFAQVRTTVEQLRLVPAHTLFPALERASYDTARALGKEVVFVGQGGALRVDAHVLEVLQGALLQVVGNAVAHGIEAPADRLAAGKPTAGRVQLAVARHGACMVFTCSDDGAGINLAAVREAARQRGMLHGERADAGDDAAGLLALLLRGGISTAQAVSEMSGRGLGLDLARAAVERLGGEVKVRSQPGQGVQIELLVPLSLTSFEALQVLAGDATVALPLGAVRSSLRMPSAQLSRSGQGLVLLHGGMTLPFLALEHLLNPQAPASRGPRVWSVVVVEGAQGLAAIGVDRILTTARILLRPLPWGVPATPLLAGVSLNASGNPQLVLDADNLVALAQQAQAPAAQADAPAPHVLVVDDSLTSRMLEQSILESAGYRVSCVNSAEEALEVIAHTRFALYLVDVEMPGMSGFEFLEQIRANPTATPVPAVLVTSRGSASDRQRGAAVGAQGYIVKGQFDQVEFLRRVRELVTP